MFYKLLQSIPNKYLNILIFFDKVKGEGGSCNIFAWLAYIIENFMLNQLVFTSYQNSKYFSRYRDLRIVKIPIFAPKIVQNWAINPCNSNYTGPNSLNFYMLTLTGTIYLKIKFCGHALKKSQFFDLFSLFSLFWPSCWFMAATFSRAVVIKMGWFFIHSILI